VKQYIVVMVNSRWAKTYHGENGKLRLIKTDSVVHLNEYDPGLSHHNKKLSFFNMVARQFDLIAAAYEMPVFLVGNKGDLDAMYPFISNKKNIVQLIDKNTKYLDEKALLKLLTPFINDWRTIRETFLIQQMEDARVRSMLVTGSRNIPTALKTTVCKLLLIEENYHELSPVDFINRESGSEPSYNIYDKLDQVIEDVLQKGGDIEIVHPGLLKDDLNMAMICASPSTDDGQGDVSNRSGSDRFL
jgi:hypothetical protein